MTNKVTIKYYSQAFFILQDKNTKIFIDPYSQIGDLIPPKFSFSPDILVITHEHPDHSNREYAKDNTFEISHPGEHDVKEVIIQGFNTFHDKFNGTERGFNTIYSINFNGINFVHLGDLGTTLNKSQIEALGVVDVLFIPVGGHYTIDYKDAIEIVNSINPNIIVPMHYKTDKTDSLPLERIDKFLEEYEGIKEEVVSLDLNSSDFDTEDFEQKVIIFNPSNG